MILAALIINGEVALQHDFLAVSEKLAIGEQFAAKEHTTERRVSVFECKVSMS